MIAGIDLSSRALHICTLHEDTNHADIHVVRLDLQRGDATTRARRLRDLMPARTAWADQNTTLIALEKPFFHGHQGLVPLLLVYGGLLQLIPPDMPLLELRADDWRRECSLPTRGDKTLLKKAAQRFARDVWADPPAALDDNTADAFCIAWAAREIDIRASAEAVA